MGSGPMVRCQCGAKKWPQTDGRAHWDAGSGVMHDSLSPCERARAEVSPLTDDTAAERNAVKEPVGEGLLRAIAGREALLRRLADALTSAAGFSGTDGRLCWCHSAACLMADTAASQEPGCVRNRALLAEVGP